MDSSRLRLGRVSSARPDPLGEMDEIGSAMFGALTLHSPRSSRTPIAQCGTHTRPAAVPGSSAGSRSLLLLQHDTTSALQTAGPGPGTPSGCSPALPRPASPRIAPPSRALRECGPTQDEAGRDAGTLLNYYTQSQPKRSRGQLDTTNNKHPWRRRFGKSDADPKKASGSDCHVQSPSPWPPWRPGPAAAAAGLDAPPRWRSCCRASDCLLFRQLYSGTQC